MRSSNIGALCRNVWLAFPVNGMCSLRGSPSTVRTSLAISPPRMAKADPWSGRGHHTLACSSQLRYEADADLVDNRYGMAGKPHPTSRSSLRASPSFHSHPASLLFPFWCQLFSEKQKQMLVFSSTLAFIARSHAKWAMAMHSDTLTPILSHSTVAMSTIESVSQ